MKILSLSHMCDVEKLTDNSLFYNGPSPDEVALVEFAQKMGFECTLSTDDEVSLKFVVKDYFMSGDDSGR